MSKKTSNTYKQLLSKSQETLEKEQLDLRVEQANLSFSQGLLSMKGNLLQAESNVKQAESNVKSSELALENAKASHPDRLVQSLVDAKTLLDQSNLELEASKEELKRMKDLYSYLEKTQNELF